MTKLALIVLITASSFAATFDIIGPCSETPQLSASMKVGVTNVGDATIKFLDLNNVDYIGSRVGMKSIFNSPTGLDAMEIISDYEMNAHGWCYSVNGHEPNIYPDEVELKDTDHVIWWYGFAHYYKGEWLSMCEPTWKRAPSQFCN